MNISSDEYQEQATAATDKENFGKQSTCQDNVDEIWQMLGRLQNEMSDISMDMHSLRSVLAEINSEQQDIGIEMKSYKKLEEKFEQLLGSQVETKEQININSNQRHMRAISTEKKPVKVYMGNALKRGQQLIVKNDQEDIDIID